MMGVPGGPPPPDAPFEESIRKYRHITAMHPKSSTTSAECATFHDAFSPRMHQERVMSKASETKEKHYRPIESANTSNCYHSSSDHSNTITAGCLTVCGNHDT